MYPQDAHSGHIKPLEYCSIYYTIITSFTVHSKPGTVMVTTSTIVTLRVSNSIGPPGPECGGAVLLSPTQL